MTIKGKKTVSRYLCDLVKLQDVNDLRKEVFRDNHTVNQNIRLSRYLSTCKTKRVGAVQRNRLRANTVSYQVGILNIH